MEYDSLAVIPTVILFIVVTLALGIRLAFRRSENLKLGKAQVFKGLHPNAQTLRASYIPARPAFLVITFAALFAWSAWHIWTLQDPVVSALKPFYILFGGYSLLQFTLSSFVRPYRIRQEHQEEAYTKLSAAVLVPVYNEDIDGLKKGLRSLMTQTVLPREIHVVDDGSKVDYTSLKRWFRATAKKAGVKVTWSRQVNSGKRAAQILGYSKVNKDNVTIIITVDSDGELDPSAIEEGLKPFATSKEIQSVAGVVIAKNAQTNLLARITDLIFVSSQQLIDRATMSVLKSVIVNSGGLALYRKEVMEAALDNEYDNEFFMGRKVTFSDDSYLTLIALKLGKTVQQPSALVFSDMPILLGHHVRQQVRWSRGSFIRGWWRIRYLPILSAGWLRQVSGWVVFASISVVQLMLLVIVPILRQELPSVYLVIIPVLFVFLLSSRYFSIKRSDMRLRSQIGTYFLAPFAMVWSAVVLRSVRLYAIATCLKTGWGTRQKVEIVYKPDTQELANSTS